jgi:hypothetical protein
MILVTEHKIIPDHKLSKLELYSNNQSLELDEIGWRASESYYCMVLTRPTLTAMRGESDGKT